MNVTSRQQAPWVCPSCQAPLESQGGGWRCCHGHGSWPERGGIPIFAQAPGAYWGELSQEDMQALLEEVERRPWRDVLRTSLALQNPGLYRYATDITRADGLLLVPLEEESCVLHYGSGWGTLAWALAPWVASIVALDSTWERLRFLQLKAAQEGWHNIHPICAGDQLPLPLPARHFDLVVLNGVLEWVPLSFPRSHPQSAQEAVLEESYRLLRPGGKLYLGIENRYGFPHFAGAVAHGDLPFASILPRRLSNWLSIMLRGQAYRTWTHSHRSYTRLLRQAGFADLQFYWPYPRYIQPDQIVPLEDGAALFRLLSTAQRGARLRRRILLRSISHLHHLGLWKHLAPTYVIVARKAKCP